MPLKCKILNQMEWKSSKFNTTYTRHKFQFQSIIFVHIQKICCDWALLIFSWGSLKKIWLSTFYGATETMPQNTKCKMVLQEVLKHFLCVLRNFEFLIKPYQSVSMISNLYSCYFLWGTYFFHFQRKFVLDSFNGAEVLLRHPKSWCILLSHDLTA